MTCKAEKNIAREILIAASKAGHRLFINARGKGWSGGPVERHADGSVTVHNARAVTYGLGPDGSADLLGWTRDGRFASVEVKRPGEYPRQNQKDWMAAVRRAGGVAGVARSVEDALRILEERDV